MNSMEIGVKIEDLPTGVGNKLAISGWTNASKKAAIETAKRYGMPQEATEQLLIWRYNSPWKRTVVYRKSLVHNFPRPHRDVLAHTVDYRVPANMVNDLIAFDGSIVVDRTAGELTVHCSSEEMNRVIFNLAHDIIVGARSWEDARGTLQSMGSVFRLKWPSQYASELNFGRMDPTTAVQFPDRKRA